MHAQPLVDKVQKKCNAGRIAVSTNGAGATGYPQIFFKKNCDIQGGVKINVQL